MNQRLTSLFLAGWLAGAPVLAAPLPDRTLSLEESVRLALNNSQALLSTREDVNIALQRVREAESLFFPRLDLNANWSKFRVEEQNTPLMLEPILGPTLIPSSPRENFYTARASIYQPVYEGGRSQNLFRQARISYERAKNTSESLQTQVAAGAKQAFYDLRYAKEREKYLRDLLKLSDAAASRSRGNIPEELRYESDMSFIRTEVSQAIQAEQDAQRSFLQTLNLELNTTVALKGAFETHPVDLDLAKLLAWSEQYRSELRQTEFQQELDSLGVALSLAERRPTVGFGATYERTGNELALPVENWAGTLNFNLPFNVSDVVFGWAKVRERKALYRQATLKHAEVADQVQLQVREAYDRYQFWQGELAPRQESLRRMESLLAEMDRQKSSSLDRLEAERLVTEARIRFLEAVHGHLVALAAIERAVGKPLNEDR